MRHTLMGFVGIAMLLATAAAPAAGHAAAAEAVIKDTTDQVLGKLRSEGDSLKNDPGKLYALIDELRAAPPDVEIESCASGGGRIDLGILERTDRVWTSDDFGQSWSLQHAFAE